MASPKLCRGALCTALEKIGLIRLNLTGLLTEEEQAELGFAGPVQEYSPETAAAFLAGMDARLTPERAGALRAAVWEAFLRQNLEALPAALPDGLRAVSSRLLTDLTAADLYTLGQTLNFLAAGPAGAAPLPKTENAGEGPEDSPVQDGALRITAGVLPGRWSPQNGRYEFDEDTAALAVQLFGAQPTPDAENEEAPEAVQGPEGREETGGGTAGTAPPQGQNDAEPAAQGAPAVSPAAG